MPLAKIAKFVAAVLGLIATAFAIIQGFREYRPTVPKLQAALVNVEHVSSRTEIPDVKISLAFKDQSVSDLWLCRVRFENIGGVTLVANGSKPNMQGPVIVAVPDKYEILKIEIKGIDPKDSGFEAHIAQKKDTNGVLDTRQFEVTFFDQWRKGEAIEAVLYLAGSGENADRPKLIPKGRPILDGDVTAADFSTVAASDISARSTLARMVGPSWASAMRKFAFYTMLLTFIVIGYRREVGTGIPERGLTKWVKDHAVIRTVLQTALLIAIYIAMLVTLFG
jgi:hypothetical protein